VLRSTDVLCRKLCKAGKWMYFSCGIKYGGKYPDVDMNLLQGAVGKPIVDIFCKGKEYYICLGGNISIRAHHIMKGHWMFEPDQPNTHFELNFVSIDEKTGLVDEEVRLFYVNSRFGEFNIFTTQQQLIDALDRLAPGFIGRFPITKEYWMERFSTFNDRLVRGILMDQKILCSGVGNYLLQEIMYCARLDLEVTTKKLSTEMISHLYDVCLYVITGHYRKTLEKVIYKKKVCPNGHQLIIGKTGGRPSFYCPIEQLKI